jgi:hypothetical protein
VKYKRSVIEVKIRLDPVPGWGYTPEDHIKFLQEYLDSTCPWYKPEVKLLRVEEEPQGSVV